MSSVELLAATESPSATLLADAPFLIALCAGLALTALAACMGTAIYCLTPLARLTKRADGRAKAPS